MTAALSVMLTLVPVTPVGADTAATTVLQLNLCSSGFAVCFTGRAVGRAVDVVGTVRPDALTLNEVCEPDVERLRRAVAEAGGPDGTAVSRFVPVTDARTGRAVLCRDGGRYGVGVVVRTTGSPDGSADVRGTWSGTYPLQDAHQAERRVWACLAVAARPTVCTTHLSSGSAAFALGQCRYLFGQVVPALGTSAPVVVSGDLNLRSGTAFGLRPCVPLDRRPGTDVDDGGVQHVVAGVGTRVVTRRLTGMRGTTDHPGLVVELTSG